MMGTTFATRATFATTALALAGAGLLGCGGEERRTARERDLSGREDRPSYAEEDAARKKVASYVLGRWAGAPVAPPPGVWFEKADVDVVFGPGGEFSFVLRTFAKRPYELRFEGRYELATSRLILVEEANLGGDWRVSGAEKDALTLESKDMKLALRRRFGT